MKLPEMILFDYGQTLITEQKFDGLKGTGAALQYAIKNKYHLSAEQVQAKADEINRETGRFHPDKSRLLQIEIPNIMFTPYLYESLGIEIALSNAEIDTVFWNAASPGTPTEGIKYFLEYLKNSLQGTANAGHWVFMIASCFIALLSLLFLMNALPMFVSFKYKFKSVVKNSVIFSITMLLIEMILIVLLALPFLLLLSSFTKMIFYVAFAMIGFGFYAMAITALAHNFFDSTIIPLYEYELKNKEKEERKEREREMRIANANRKNSKKKNKR